MKITKKDSKNFENLEITTDFIYFIQNVELSYNFVRATNFCGNHKIFPLSCILLLNSHSMRFYTIFSNTKM